MSSNIPYFKTELPPKNLLDHPTWESFRNFGEQWSRLVAWSWLRGSNLAEQEQKLKTVFIDFLQRQAQSTEIAVKCDVEDEVHATALNLSTDIKNMLLGEKNIPGITIKLSDVLERLTGEGLMTTVKDDVREMFREKIFIRVITDSFIGRITYAWDNDNNIPNTDKYILELAYPPCPAFSDATVTEQILYNWANNLIPGDFYGPPSAYIPWSAS